MSRRLSQRAWQAEQIRDLPPAVVGFLEEGHAERLAPDTPRSPESSSPWYVPNQWLVSVTRKLRRSKLWKAFNEEVIHGQANTAARICNRLKSFPERVRFAYETGVQPPEPDRIRTYPGCAARLTDPQWWRRQFRKVWTRSAECGLRELGMIRRGQQCYVSDSAVFFRRAMKRRMLGFLRSHQLLSEHGELLELANVAERSLANPKLRVGEMMCRLRGMEEYAQAHGHTWAMFTLTCPSAFHPQLSKGAANPAYNGSSVREAQAWLCRMWARTRARLKKKEVLTYGFRAAEPHHDGTPHWHVLVFGKLQAIELFEGIVRRVWMSEYGAEPGAPIHRVNSIRADPTRGSAVGYMAKYLAKNIDGSPGQSGDDLESGTAVHVSSLRVETWATLHGIRQFQQLGGPSVGLWREYRRIRDGDELEDSDMRAVWATADRGDYSGFIRNCGGIRAGRRTNTKLEKVDQHRKNRYGEDKGPCVVGVRYATAVYITRTTEWRIIPCGTTLPPSAFSSSAASLGASSDITSGTIPSPTNRPRRLNRFHRPAFPVSAETPAERRMWRILELRSRGSRQRVPPLSGSGSSPGSSLGPVAITVTGTPHPSEPAGPEKHSESTPDTG